MIHADHLLDELAEAYGLSDESLLRAISDRSASLPELLLRARQKVRDYFGASASVRLSIKPDPEIPSHRPITVEIVPPETNVNAFELLEKFDAEWWIDATAAEPAEVCILLSPR